MDVQNHVGESVLFSAVRLREVDCTRILVQYGDPNLQNIRGDTVSGWCEGGEVSGWCEG